MYFLYILRCKDNSLYCGQTNNLDKRLQEHILGKSRSAKYTKGRGPLKLVYTEKHTTLREVLKREIAIKKLTKKQKEKLISK